MAIALIFASAYPQQEYDTYVAAVSRAAVIYVTALFCGVLAMLTVVPVVAADRPAFYREQQSRMYSVFIYCVTLFLIEVRSLPGPFTLGSVISPSASAHPAPSNIDPVFAGVVVVVHVAVLLHRGL
jgi:hypothetical protein